MGSLIEEIIINNEEDAWTIFQKALHNELSGTEKISFEGWPIFNLTIEGKDFNGSIPTRIMLPIIDLQKEIYRIYCKAKYNSENSRHLTNDERELLELIVIIKPGSTEFITDLFKALNEIIANSKMDGKQVLVLLIGISLMITASIMWKDWLIAKEKEHGQETSIKLSKQETERVKLITGALSKEPELKNNNQSIDNIKSNLSKRLRRADQIKINDEPIIDGARAMEIVPAPKEISKDVRLDGNYNIKDVRFPQKLGGKYRLSVINLADDKTFMVDAAPDLLSEKEISILKEGGFSVKPLSLKINAKELRGNITDAKIISIEWPD